MYCFFHSSDVLLDTPPPHSLTSKTVTVAVTAATESLVSSSTFIPCMNQHKIKLIHAKWLKYWTLQYKPYLILAYIYNWMIWSFGSSHTFWVIDLTFRFLAIKEKDCTTLNGNNWKLVRSFLPLCMPSNTVPCKHEVS